MPNLTVNDARDMHSRDVITTFREKRTLKGKKLYNQYAHDETIAIISEDEGDVEFTKHLRSNPPSPVAFASMVKVKLEVLTLEEANEKHLRDKEKLLCLQKATAEEPHVCNEFVELRALLLEQ